MLKRRKSYEKHSYRSKTALDWRQLQGACPLCCPS